MKRERKNEKSAKKNDDNTNDEHLDENNPKFNSSMHTQIKKVTSQ
jgi:ribosomal protein S20